MEEEVETSFDEEVEWCINQLLLGLTRGTSNSEQILESKKVINKLQSTKLPYVAKRQLMTVIFGDYRKMMRQMPLQKTRDELSCSNLRDLCLRHNIKLLKK